MSHSNRTKSSEYMYWAKTHAHVRYHLASSGLMNLAMRELQFHPEELELTSDAFYGYKPLQKAIAEKEDVDPDIVFTTLGTSLANHIAIAAIIDHGDEILIEHPTYELILSTAGYLGAKIKRFPRRPENDFQIDPSDIRRMISPQTRLIILTNLHNPSSSYTEEKTLIEIGEIARSVRAIVMVDEVYLDALFDLKHRSAVHLGPEFISTNSLTKIYGLSGLRCGWVLAPRVLVDKMWRLNDLFHVNLPHPTEQLSVAALRNLGRIRTLSRSILEENHQALNTFIGEQEDLKGVHPGYGTVFFPRLLSGDVETFSMILQNNFDTSIVPGKYFEMPEYIRIGLGMKPEIFREGLRRIGMALGMLHPH
jgi:aspartate/methionine/tyrosine aminotransferase